MRTRLRGSGLPTSSPAQEGEFCVRDEPGEVRRPEGSLRCYKYLHPGREARLSQHPGRALMGRGGSQLDGVPSSLRLPRLGMKTVTDVYVCARGDRRIAGSQGLPLRGRLPRVPNPSEPATLGPGWLQQGGRGRGPRQALAEQGCPQLLGSSSRGAGARLGHV